MKFTKETPIGNFDIEVIGVNVNRGQVNTKINNQDFSLDFTNRQGKNVLLVGKYRTKEILGKEFKQDVCFTLPAEIENYIKAEIENVTRKEKEEKEKYINDIKEGKVKIIAKYHDGEYLSDYQVFGEEAEILEEIGVE